MSSMATVFVDSTTLLYPLDLNSPQKARASRAWLKRLRDQDRLVTSPQVLNECYWIVARKPASAEARALIRDYLRDHALWATAPLHADALLEAWCLEDRFRVGFWDALMLASAHAAGCGLFLSEDLNDGQSYGRVRAINPFRHAPEDVLGPALR